MKLPMTLVTTELEETWPVSGKAFFLGEWCRLHARKEKWQAIDGGVLPYHWNDRIKLKCDFETLQKLNRELLLELVPVMNSLHGESHDICYWRILLGYWLNLYTAVLFDRWSSIECVQKMGLQLETNIIATPESLLATNDTESFTLQACSNPLWNNSLFEILIRRKPSISISTIYSTITRESPSSSHRSDPIQRLKSWIKSFAGLAIHLNRNNQFAIAGSYYPRADEWQLETKLGQIPIGYWNIPQSPSSEFNSSQRKWDLSPRSASNEFESLVREILPRVIPRVFVEGYSQLRQMVQKLPWPISPLVIWTSNHHFVKDVFKAWTAQKCSEGARLVIGEHGGGGGAFNGARNYELSISDCYFSTGWVDPQYRQIVPIGNFRQVHQRRSARANGRALLVCGIMPRYSFDIRSMMLSSQVSDYFEDQFRFVDALSQQIRMALLVRLCREDYQWGQKERWTTRHPSIELDGGKAALWKIAQSCRLCICSYNATTHLESLYLNFPTIMFWNPNRWELNKDSIPYFEHLEQVGIFHKTPEAAANHIMGIWDDLPGWWQSTEVQEARRQFCDRYIANPSDLQGRIEAALRAEAKLSKQNRFSIGCKKPAPE